MIETMQNLVAQVKSLQERCSAAEQRASAAEQLLRVSEQREERHKLIINAFVDGVRALGKNANVLATFNLDGPRALEYVQEELQALARAGSFAAVPPAPLVTRPATPPAEAVALAAHVQSKMKALEKKCREEVLTWLQDVFAKHLVNILRGAAAPDSVQFSCTDATAVRIALEVLRAHGLCVAVTSANVVTVVTDLKKWYEEYAKHVNEAPPQAVSQAAAQPTLAQAMCARIATGAEPPAELLKKPRRSHRDWVVEWMLTDDAPVERMKDSLERGARFYHAVGHTRKEETDDTISALGEFGLKAFVSGSGAETHICVASPNVKAWYEANKPQ